MTGYDPARYLPLHRIVTIETAPGEVTAEIADNIHQFSVVVIHHEGQVTELRPSAKRVPWTTCPGALARLRDLVGAPVDGGSPPWIDKSRQCTHLFDLARLAMANAARSGRHRYDVHVALGHDGGSVEVQVLANGVERLRWTVIDDHIVSEGPFQGHSTTSTSRWPDIGPDLYEAALLGRRALLVFLGSGRSRGTQYATDLPYMAGACHSFRPETVGLAARPAQFRQFPADAVPELIRG